MAYTIRRTFPIITATYHSDGQYYTVCVDADIQEQHFTKGELTAYLATLMESEVDSI